MDPEGLLEFDISDVVVSTTGKDCGKLFYVIGTDPVYLQLANGRERTLENPQKKKGKHVKKVILSETRVAEKLRHGDKVLNSQLRRDLAYWSREMQANNLGG